MGTAASGDSPGRLLSASSARGSAYRGVAEGFDSVSRPVRDHSTVGKVVILDLDLGSLELDLRKCARSTTQTEYNSNLKAHLQNYANLRYLCRRATALLQQMQQSSIAH